MVRKNNYRIVETIITTLKEADTQLSYEELSKQTNIRANSLKMWLRIIELIQNSVISISFTENGVLSQSVSDGSVNVRTRIKKREEDPKIQEFLSEFKGVLSRTKTSLEDDNIKNYPHLKTQKEVSSRLSSEYTDLQSELTQVLEQGISFLSSSEQIDEGDYSKSETGFMKELKQAVTLGIENLEKVVVTDYKAKKGRVNTMKSELELVFEARKKRLKERKTN